MRNYLKVFTAVFLLTSLVFGSGYEFEGVGVREVSRGGAAIAGSRDWTTIYWNPGNIAAAVQNGRRDKRGGQAGLKIFGGSAHAKDSNSLSSVHGAIFDKSKLSSPFILGALGAVLPVGEKGGIGFGFYTPLLQGVDFTDTSPTLPTTLDQESSAGILVWNVSGSYSITPRLSIGTGLDVLYGEIDSKTRVTNPFGAPGMATSDLDANGWGLEGTFGIRFQPSNQWIFGAVYRSGADVHLTGDGRATFTGLPNENTSFEYDLRHPPTSGIGLAYVGRDKWSWHLDFTQTYWNRFSNALSFGTDGSLLFDTPNTFDWRNTWKIKTGVEVHLTEATDFMTGYSFDRYAIDGTAIDFATAIDVPMHRWTVGTSHAWNERWESLVGAVVGYGERREGNLTYRLTGWQLMYETRLNF